MWIFGDDACHMVARPGHGSGLERLLVGVSGGGGWPRDGGGVADPYMVENQCKIKVENRKTKKKKSLVNHLIANFEGWIGHGFQRSCELLGPNFLIIDSPFLTYINVFVINY